MAESWGGQDVPFSAKCPMCGATTRGFVGKWYCLGGGGPLSEKVTGLVQHSCDKCGEIIGVRLKVVGKRTAVLETGEFAKMRLSDMSSLSSKRTEAMVGGRRVDAKALIDEMNRFGERFTNQLRDDQGEDAIDTFCKMFELQPDWTQFHYDVLDHACRKERLTSSLYSALKARVDKNPTSTTLLYLLGLLLQTISQQKEAVTVYCEAIRANPDFGVAHHNLGLAYRLTGEVRKAIDAWQTATRVNPRLAEPHFALGTIFMKESKTKDAVEHFRKFLDLLPPHLQGYRAVVEMNIQMLT